MKFELKSGFILTSGSSPWILEIPALSRAVLPKPPFEPVSAKLAYLASGFYFFTWILEIPCWLLAIVATATFAITICPSYAFIKSDAHRIRNIEAAEKFARHRDREHFIPVARIKIRRQS